MLICDGAADKPIETLGGRTPLEAADTPNMDEIASRGTMGTLSTVPPGMKPGSDVANLSLLGYDPATCYSGRGPIEAANIGVIIPEGWTVFRCNLVATDGRNMIDYSAGHISRDDSAEILEALDEKLGDRETRFFPGNTYRNLLLLKGDYSNLECTPPHDITGEPLDKHMPMGEGMEKILDLMERSRKLLKELPVNKRIAARGGVVVDLIWPWSQGTRITLEPFKERFHMTGGIISAVDLILGLGKLAGLYTVEVPGITGYIDTNYRGKGEAAVRVLLDDDFVFVHVEAPDEASHVGNTAEKVKAIERFDELVLGPVLKHFTEGSDDYRVIVCPDHPTYISTKTHDSAPVPYAACGHGINRGNSSAFSEEEGRRGGPDFNPAWKLMFHLTDIDSWPGA
ncbi:MAG: cofactor-independent phosphoglycerate mutase [Actinobacteria bacterium]|nr:cofactor-independent phosphoglycerate mutase [Actinomycetota bacterium]